VTRYEAPGQGFRYQRAQPFLSGLGHFISTLCGPGLLIEKATEAALKKISLDFSLYFKLVITNLKS
jgi:hypothetical protein